MRLRFIEKAKNALNLFEGYRRHFLFIMALILITGVTEMFSVGMILPILESVINNDSSKGMGNFFSFFLDLFPEHRWTLVIILLLVVFNSLTVFFKIFNAYYSIKLIQKIQLKWRLSLLEKYLFSVYEYVLRFKQGDIIHNVNQEANRATSLLNTLIQWLTNFCIGFAIYILLLFSNFYVTLFLTVVITGIFWFVKYLGENYQMKLSKRLIKFNQAMSSITAEAILALQQIKIFSLEEKLRDLYNKTGRKRNDAIVKKKTISKIPGNISYLLMPIVLLVFYIYFTLISQQSFKEFLPTMGLIFVGFTRISSALMTVAQNRMLVYEFLPSLQLIEKIIKEPIEAEKLEQGKRFEELKDDIVFDNISFCYNKDQWIFNNLNLKIKKGRMTAIVGPSGSGKSTLSYLLVRLYEPQNGAIFVNGKDLKNYSVKSWREKIGYVTQDTYIFNMSIKENIEIGKPGASDEEIYEAAKAAYCLEFIDKLPDGWDTLVGERGMKLSGGQRQRVAIARAMIRKPELYVFDEATSALDNHSEKLVQRSIENISKNSTMLVIAHRLTTIENADVVYDLGEIETEKFLKVK